MQRLDGGLPSGDQYGEVPGALPASLTGGTGFPPLEILADVALRIQIEFGGSFAEFYEIPARCHKRPSQVNA